MSEEIPLPWVENGDWRIMDKSSAEQFRRTVRTSSRRPACVTITGSNWEEADLLNLLTCVSNRSCKVNLKLYDPFEELQETTSQLIAKVCSGKPK